MLHVGALPLPSTFLTRSILKTTYQLFYKTRIAAVATAAVVEIKYSLSQCSLQPGYASILYSVTDILKSYFRRRLLRGEAAYHP